MTNSQSDRIERLLAEVLAELRAIRAELRPQAPAATRPLTLAEAAAAGVKLGDPSVTLGSVRTGEQP